MAFSLTTFLKGLLLQNELDRTKQLALVVSPSATTGTTTTLVAAQTANVTVTLPNTDLNLNNIVTNDSVTTLTNKTIDPDNNTILLASAHILVGDSGNSAADVAVTGDISINNAGVTAYVGTVPLTKGGTGQITANAALNALLPSQAAQAGKVLGTDGTNTSWVPSSGGGSGTVTQVNTGVGLTGGPITTTGTIDMADTAVTPGSYTNANVTIDQQGRITAAASGGVPSVAIAKNFLLNSDFNFWQRSLSIASAVTNGQTSYGADRWYCANNLGTAGIMAYDQNTESIGTVDGMQYSARLRVTSAPSSGSSNGVQLIQAIPAVDARLLINQTISFSAYIIGLNNINQVQLQFVYDSGGGKPTTTLGSPVNVVVTSGSFSLVKLENISVGTTPTQTGSIGIRITANGASSGNATDVSNGFRITKAMLNIGSSAASWSLASSLHAAELAQCQRFYEKSYNYADAPGTITASACYNFNSNLSSGMVEYKASKITSPTTTFYSAGTGLTGVWYDFTAAADLSMSSIGNNENALPFGLLGSTANHIIRGHYTAEAEI